MNAKPQARVMWAIYDQGKDPIVTGNKKLIRICGRSAKRTPERVAVIPLDNVEALVERAYRAYCSTPDTTIAGIRAALAATEGKTP